MELDVANSSPADGRLPGGFDAVDRLVSKGEDQAAVFGEFRQQMEQPTSERNLPGFAFRCFGSGDVEQPAGEIHIIPTLVQDFPASKSGIDASNNDVLQVRSSDL